MHAELWHTTYCCTVADLASIFPNVKRFHCMCKLSTFLPFFYNLTIYNGKVSVLVMLLPPHICICIMYIVTPSRLPKNKRRKLERNFHPNWPGLAVLFSRQIIKGSQNLFFTLIFSFSFNFLDMKPLHCLLCAPILLAYHFWPRWCDLVIHIFIRFY